MEWRGRDRCRREGGRVGEEVVWKGGVTLGGGGRLFMCTVNLISPPSQSDHRVTESSIVDRVKHLVSQQTTTPNQIPAPPPKSFIPQPPLESPPSLAPVNFQARARVCVPQP